MARNSFCQNLTDSNLFGFALLDGYPATPFVFHQFSTLLCHCISHLLLNRGNCVGANGLGSGWSWGGYSCLVPSNSSKTWRNRLGLCKYGLPRLIVWCGSFPATVAAIRHLICCYIVQVVHEAPIFFPSIRLLCRWLWPIFALVIGHSTLTTLGEVDMMWRGLKLWNAHQLLHNSQGWRRWEKGGRWFKMRIVMLGMVVMMMMMMTMTNAGWRAGRLRYISWKGEGGKVRTQEDWNILFSQLWKVSSF